MNYVRKLRFNDVGFWFVIVIYFVLLNSYIVLGLQKHIFLITSDMRQFFLRSGDVWKVPHNNVASCFVNLLYLFLHYVINAFIFHDVIFPLWYVALRMEIKHGITYGNNVSFLFVIVTYFLFCPNYVICLFDVVTFLDDVRISLYFGTSELRMEMT